MYVYVCVCVCVCVCCYLRSLTIVFAYSTFCISYGRSAPLKKKKNFFLTENSFS